MIESSNNINNSIFKIEYTIYIILIKQNLIVNEIHETNNLHSNYYKFTRLYCLPLLHAPSCPCQYIVSQYSYEKLQEFNNKNKFNSIRLASVALISDKDNNLLLTRRNKHLKTFPGNWIFPGGNKDKNEDFITTALREVKEEVGIDIVEINNNNSKDNIKQYIIKDTNILVNINPLMYYESAYPLNVDIGEPISNHFIIFYHIHIHINYNSILLKLQPEEVDAYLWINNNTINDLIITNNFNNKSINKKNIVQAYVSSNEDYSFNSNNDKQIKNNIVYDKKDINIDLNNKMSWGHKLAFRIYQKSLHFNFKNNNKTK